MGACESAFEASAGRKPSLINKTLVLFCALGSHMHTPPKFLTSSYVMQLIPLEKASEGFSKHLLKATR